LSSLFSPSQRCCSEAISSCNRRLQNAQRSCKEHSRTFTKQVSQFSSLCKQFCSRVCSDLQL
jgi:hypothetical protein